MLRCVSCGNTKLSQYLVINGHALLRCPKCDLLITRTGDREWKQYVRDKYSHQYACDYEVMLPKLHKRFARHLPLIKGFKSGGRLLDVGCGTGHFLKYVHETDQSWSVYGVDPSNLLRNVAARNSRAIIRNGTLSAIPFDDSYFDVITCYDVLEHSMDLKRNVKELRRVLKPGGLLFVQAPNYRSLMARLTGDRWDWWCIPDHVLHFSYNCLRAYVKKNRFTILASCTYEDREDFLSNIKGIFSRNYAAKSLFYVLVPIFLMLERISWITNNGGLSVIIARK